MNVNRIARVASLIGEPARTTMLLELMDGRALTANELARAAGISAQTGSRHLAHMVEAGLLQVTQQGRHRYHRLASPEVARLIESIMQIAAPAIAPCARTVTGPKDPAMRVARTCYDHLAGRLGVAIADHLQEQGAIAFDGDTGFITDKAARTLDSIGISSSVALEHGHTPKATCRVCLDWSERKFHVAGRLGALICTHCIEQRWVDRNGRALQITAKGHGVLGKWLGAARWREVTG